MFFYFFFEESSILYCRIIFYMYITFNEKLTLRGLFLKHFCTETIVAFKMVMVWCLVSNLTTKSMRCGNIFST